MHKETITYTDFNGVKKTEDHYFNLTKAELVEMEATTEGGFGAQMQNAIDNEDQAALVRLHKKLILASYGVKTEDGRFVKNERLTEEFASSNAYSEIFMKLAQDEKAATKFANNVLPEAPKETDTHPAKTPKKK